MTMGLQGGSFFVSYLRALTDKQLLALEAWNNERRLDASSLDDAVEKLGHIMREMSRRGMQRG